MINLTEKMSELVNKNVEHWRSDLKYDFEIIKENKINTYLWILRQNGTQLYVKKNLLEDEETRYVANYWFNEKKRKVFIIKVKEIKDGIFYGEIREKKKDLEKIIEEM